MSRTLGIGRLQLTAMMPSGHTGRLMPKQMCLVDQAHATLDGVRLGGPVQLQDFPRIGDVAWPARGVAAIGQGVWEVLDQVEYELTRSETGGSF